MIKQNIEIAKIVVQTAKEMTDRDQQTDTQGSINTLLKIYILKKKKKNHKYILMKREHKHKYIEEKKTINSINNQYNVL
jgi:hypothetical protein